MKKSCLIMLFLLHLVCASSQNNSITFNEKPKKEYSVNINTSFTNKLFFYGFGGSFNLKNKWYASIEVKSAVQNSKQTPNDFSSGFTLFGEDKIPNDVHNIYTISLTREFKSKQRKIKPAFEVGSAYMENFVATDFRHIGGDGGFIGNWSVNYTYTYKKNRSFGLLIKPKLKILFSKKLGMELSLWNITGTKDNYYGAEISMLWGRLRS